MTKNKSTFKKLHKWPGLILGFLMLYYAITGIFMNHREWISGFDVNRNILPQDFQYKNWNNAALKGNVIINSDSIIVYGNLGIWVTDSTFKSYTKFTNGIPKGADNYKTFDVHQTKKGNLFAATQMGLFGYNKAEQAWQKFKLNVDINRFVAIESIGDSVLAMNRSFLFVGKDKGEITKFNKVQIKTPSNYSNQVTLFKTIWQIHSGEILGIPGKLFVDFIGLITIFISITGIIYFLFPNWIKKRKKRGKPITNHTTVNRWSLKWHNKFGAWLFVFMIILFFSGMFLRPPVLIAISKSKVSPIPYSHLDQPNPWYDKLRDLLYDSEQDQLIFSTSEGMFEMPRTTMQPNKCAVQPPISVMGINSFEPYGNGAFMVGSFSGLFIWHPKDVRIFDYIEQRIYEGSLGGRPIGKTSVSGIITSIDGSKYLSEYAQGIVPINHKKQFPSMPEELKRNARMSLWNLSLEIHTGRFFRPLLGSFYILLVPLSSILAVMVTFSGYVIYRRKFKKKPRKRSI